MRTFLSRHNLPVNMSRSAEFCKPVILYTALRMFAGKLCLERMVRISSTANFSLCGISVQVEASYAGLVDQFGNICGGGRSWYGDMFGGQGVAAQGGLGLAGQEGGQGRGTGVGPPQVPGGEGQGDTHPHPRGQGGGGGQWRGEAGVE